MIGGVFQDLSYMGSLMRVVIGDYNVICENVIINCGFEKEKGIMFIGSYCLFMVGSYVVYDCIIGSYVVIVNGSMLGGHVYIYDYVMLFGFIGVYYFLIIGCYGFVGGMSCV